MDIVGLALASFGVKRHSVLMSFEVSLILVSFIIVAAFLTWQWMNAKPAETAPPVVAAQPTSALDDQSVRRGRLHLETLREPALLKVSELCNDKEECVMPISATALGNPLWQVRASSGHLALKCDKAAK